MNLAVQTCQTNPFLSVDEALLQCGFAFDYQDGTKNPTEETTHTHADEDIANEALKKKRRVELIRRLRKLGCTNPGVTATQGHRGRPAGSRDKAKRKARTCPQCHQSNCPNSKPGPKRYNCMEAINVPVQLHPDDTK